MSFDLKTLYELLPALYRTRDTESGSPLETLLALIAEQLAVLEEDMAQLYDDQFIETCAEWVVPYIGELVGTRSLVNIPNAPFTQRGEVANTLAYRRRKGTAAIIEQLSRDVTGWDASVIEYFKLLSTTQYMHHLRPENIAMNSLKNKGLLEYLNTPFDASVRTADVRSIQKKRGKYNIHNVGIYLWRLGSYSLTNSPAFKVDDLRFTFNALGLKEPLYNLPDTEPEITYLAEPVNVPIPISRMVLRDNLETYYGNDKKDPSQKKAKKSLLIYKDGIAVLPGILSPVSNPPSQSLNDIISVRDLSDLNNQAGICQGWANMPQDKIAIDPVLGRLAFPSNAPPPAKVNVSYHHGFSAELGGGEYARSTLFTKESAKIINVHSGNGTIQDALDQLVFSGGIVEIQDNEYYFESPVIRVAKGNTLELRSADSIRPVLVLSNEMLIEAEENSSVILDGLLICGSCLRVPMKCKNNHFNKLELLRITHCTFFPGSTPKIREVAAQRSQPRIIIESPGTTINIDKCITGALRIFEGADAIITSSIIDALDENSVAYSGLSGNNAGGTIHVENSTIIGKVNTRIMKLASNSIFLSGMVKSIDWLFPVITHRLQEGCARFSYFSPGSKIPRPYKCQPSSSSRNVAVRPAFTSLTYGDPGYCQLSNNCPPEIASGADDEAEMGAFHDLYQPQRVSNLRVRLDEYLRFGLEAGIFYAS